MLLLCSQARGNGEQDKADSSSKTFMWEIASDEGKLYLLGSVHLLPKSVHPLSETIQKAYEESDILVVEANPFQGNMMSIQQKMFRKGKYEGDNTLKKNIPNKLYRKLVETCKEKNLYGAFEWNSMKPWFAAQMLTQVALARLGYQPQHGLDFHFLKKAQGEEKKILELESMQYQIELFTDISKALQISLLKETLSELKKLETLMDKTLKYWKNGNRQGLRKLLFKKQEQSPERKKLYRKLFDKRNQNWMKKLKEYLASDKVHFVVVGAGHFLGDKGLLNLLREEGYDVEQCRENS